MILILRGTHSRYYPSRSPFLDLENEVHHSYYASSGGCLGCYPSPKNQRIPFVRPSGYRNFDCETNPSKININGTHVPIHVQPKSLQNRKRQNRHRQHDTSRKCEFTLSIILRNRYQKFRYTRAQKRRATPSLAAPLARVSRTQAKTGLGM